MKWWWAKREQENKDKIQKTELLERRFPIVCPQSLSHFSVTVLYIKFTGHEFCGGFIFRTSDIIILLSHYISTYYLPKSTRVSYPRIKFPILCWYQSMSFCYLPPSHNSFRLAITLQFLIVSVLLQCWKQAIISWRRFLQLIRPVRSLKLRSFRQYKPTVWPHFCLTLI